MFLSCLHKILKAFLNVTLQKDLYLILKENVPTSAPSEDSDQPVHSRSLIRIFTGCMLDSQGYKVSVYMQTMKTLIRLCEYAGSFNSSFGAHIRRYVFWPCGVLKGRYMYVCINMTSCLVKGKPANVCMRKQWLKSTSISTQSSHGLSSCRDLGSVYTTSSPRGNVDWFNFLLFLNRKVSDFFLSFASLKTE